MLANLKSWFRDQLQKAFNSFGFTVVRTESLNQFESDYISCVRVNGARYWKRHYVARL